VCENHPSKAWSELGCQCGAGMLCECNRAEGYEEPDTSEVIIRRRVELAVEARILELKASGDGMLKIGHKLGIGTSVVQRVFKQVPTTPELKGYL
jgi:hypothetical protein